MRFKSGVVIIAPSELELDTLRVVDVVTWEVLHREAFVTTYRDGNHSENSKHYWRPNEGVRFAIDLRTWRDVTNAMLGQLPRTKREEYVRELRVALARTRLQGFSVVLERTHVHVQYPRPS